MKNFMVANSITNHARYSEETLKKLMSVHVENSFDLGWKKEEMILIANFDFEYLGVKSFKTSLNDFCLKGSKVFALKWYWENFKDDDIIWTHDLDAWQNAEFKCPDFKDVGASHYSKPKFNGGSIFWRNSGKDILEKIVSTIVEDNAPREEPTINRIFKSDEFKDRVTTLNNTFNVGCSGFVKRYNASDKPIKVCHFHPYNRIAWETHTMDRNDIGDENISVSRRLERLIRKYFTDLPIKLKGGRKHGKEIKKDDNKKV